MIKVKALKDFTYKWGKKVEEGSMFWISDNDLPRLVKAGKVKELFIPENRRFKNERG